MGKTIETYEDLLDWAKRANICMDLKIRIALQDEFGHSKTVDLESAYAKAVEVGDRNLIAFAIMKVEGSNHLENFFRVWARRHTVEWQQFYGKEFQKRCATLERGEAALAEGKRAIFRKISNLNKQIRLLQNTNERFRSDICNYKSQVDELHIRIKDCVKNANKWLHFKAMLEEN